MSTTDLIFRLLALDEASAVFKKASASAKETAGATEEANEANGLFGGKAGAMMLGVAAGAALVGAKSVEMAEKFQSSMATLVTGAGESQSNLGMVSNGILDMAVKTGTSTQQLISGMYMIESAGFHGAAGLQVLQAAAEGAKVGNADLSTVGNALTDVLNDYHQPASNAVAITNELVATVSAGKMQMQDLAGSLSNVVPLASAAGLSYAQVGGAIATMTGHGMSADQATQDLANTIRSLQNPNSVAVKEMTSLGLSSTQVSTQLGKQGLTGTLSELTAAITSHMGPAGTVLQSTFASSTNAAADAQKMIGAMPASLQKLAQSYLAGSVTAKGWRTDLQGLDPVQANLMQQFASTADKAHSFNSLLTAGGPAVQTYEAALSEMTGGATGLNTALMLTGENAGTFQANVNAIGAAGQKAGKDVNGWGEITQTTAFKLDQVKEVVETLGIRIGTVLLPVVNKIITGFMDTAKWAMEAGTWMAHHKTIVEALGIAIAVMLVPPLAAVAISAVSTAAAFVTMAAPFVAIGVGIAALAYGFLQLINHWTEVKAFFSHAAHDVEQFFEHDLIDPVVGFFTHDIPKAWDWVVNVWDSDVAKPFSTGVAAVGSFFENDLVNPIVKFFTVDIPGAWQAGVNLFKAIFVTPIVAEVNFVETAFSAAFNAIPKLVSAGFSLLVAIVKAPINGVIDIVDTVIHALDDIHVSIPSWVPFVGGQSFGISIPAIPQLAAGGLVLPQPGGTLINAAEAGKPEIVSPLPALEQAMTVAMAQANPYGNFGGGPGSADSPLHMILEVHGDDGAAINRKLVIFRRNGGQFTAAVGVH